MFGLLGDQSVAQRVWYPIFGLRYRFGPRKATKASVRIGGLRTEIWNRDLPYTKQECYPLNSDIRRKVLLTWPWLYNVSMVLLICSSPQHTAIRMNIQGAELVIRGGGEDISHHATHFSCGGTVTPGCILHLRDHLPPHPHPTRILGVCCFH
jgi:hypothetical protein